MFNIILKNFNSSFNVIKLVLPAGRAVRTPLLSTIFTQYNFELANNFFEKFNNLTNFLSIDILLPVFLYLPDSDSIDDNFFFFIKSPTNYFLLKKLIFFPILDYNNKNFSIIFFFNIVNLFKIALIKAIFLNVIIPNSFTLYYYNIRNFFLSLKGQLKSIQNLTLNNIYLSSKNFLICLYI